MKKVHVAAILTAVLLILTLTGFSAFRHREASGSTPPSGAAKAKSGIRTGFHVERDLVEGLLDLSEEAVGLEGEPDALDALAGEE